MNVLLLVMLSVIAADDKPVEFSPTPEQMEYLEKLRPGALRFGNEVHQMNLRDKQPGDYIFTKEYVLINALKGDGDTFLSDTTHGTVEVTVVKIGQRTWCLNSKEKKFLMNRVPQTYMGVTMLRTAWNELTTAGMISALLVFIFGGAFVAPLSGRDPPKPAGVYIRDAIVLLIIGIVLYVSYLLTSSDLRLTFAVFALLIGICASLRGGIGVSLLVGWHKPSDLPRGIYPEADFM